MDAGVITKAAGYGGPGQNLDERGFRYVHRLGREND